MRKFAIALTLLSVTPSVISDPSGRDAPDKISVSSVEEVREGGVPANDPYLRRFGRATASRIEAPKDLDGLLNIGGKREFTPSLNKDNLHRIDLVRRAGFEIGIARAYEHAMSEYAEDIKGQSDLFDQIFAFNEIFQIANHDLPPEQSLYRQPPVISQLEDVIEVGAEGKYLRTIDGVFRIITPEKFVPQPPNWRHYLLAPGIGKKDQIYTQALWSNADERDVWQDAVVAGWQQGLLQAKEEITHRIEILGRDYLGMLAYVELKTKGKISPGYIASERRDVDGGGEELTIGNRSYQISNVSGLNAQAKDWKTHVQIDANSAFEKQGVRLYRGTKRCDENNKADCL